MDDLARFLRVLLKPLHQLVVGRTLDERTHGDVAELALGLTFELRFGQTHGNDAGQTFTNVFTEKVFVLLFEKAALFGVLVDRISQSLTETFFVHTTFGGRNAVGEGVNRLVETGVPLECDFDFLRLFGGFEVADLAEERFLRGVEVTYVVDDAAVVLKRLLHLLAGALIGEANLETLVQEGHDLKSLDHRLRTKINFFEDGGVRVEGHRGAGTVTWCVTGDGELALRLTTINELENVVLPVAVNLHRQAGREGVHDRGTHTVETTGHLVTATTKLSTGVQHGVHNFGGGLTGVLRVLVNRNATTIVNDATAAVFQNGDINTGAMASHCFVYGVVDNFPDAVV